MPFLSGPLLLFPSTRGAWGVVPDTSGPPDPPGVPRALLHAPNALVRTGVLVLSRRGTPDYGEARRCFRAAQRLYISVVGEPHAKTSYALDRIGVVHHFQGDLDQAERWYLRSLRALAPDARHGRWQAITIVNLARLYGEQGRAEERDAWLDRLLAPRRGSADGRRSDRGRP